MAKLLEKLGNAAALGALLGLLTLLFFHSDILASGNLLPILTFLHVLAAMAWVGLLYYFNLVQMPVAARLPTDLKPAIAKFIAPEALFWSRWSALATLVTGLLVAWLNGYLKQALMLDPTARTIGTGMWLALIMAFNVWFVIWPNQKKALGLVPADDTVKTAAARAAFLTSRANFVLSVPMLYCMVAARLAG